MKKLATTIILGCIAIGTAIAQPTPEYVGSFTVNQGVHWETDPPVYSGQEAAALLFGGSPEDYAISTNSNTTDPGTITNTAWYDGWGEACTEFAEDYSLDVEPAGYANPGGSGTSWSAYVSDHSCGQTNYVWRINSIAQVNQVVPTMPLFGLAVTGLGLVLVAVRRLRSPGERK